MFLTDNLLFALYNKRLNAILRLFIIIELTGKIRELALTYDFMKKTLAIKCPLCSETNCTVKKKGIDACLLNEQHFAITDSNYGTTLTIYQCWQCKFLFCPDAKDVTSFYTALIDEGYHDSKVQRQLQFQKLLSVIAKHKRSGRLLDIGAGCGILVEQACKMGYQAQGIDPCASLVKQAQKLSIPVIQGVFPDERLESKFDIITLIDVLEHVNEPMQLLQDIADTLADDAIAVIVTPDVGSIAAKLFANKWWHYRIAHIGYFNKQTLNAAVNQAGLEVVQWSRPSWYFSLTYLFERLNQYLPIFSLITKSNRLKRITIPLNMFDSWMITVKRKK